MIVSTSILPFWILSIQSEERPSPADSASLIYLSYACCCNEIFSVTFESSEDNASLRFDHVRYVLEAVVSNSSILRLIRSNFVSIQSRVSFVSSLSFEEPEEELDFEDEVEELFDDDLDDDLEEELEDFFLEEGDEEELLDGSLPPDAYAVPSKNAGSPGSEGFPFPRDFVNP